MEEAQILQGTVNYLARFMPRLSEVMQPIRRLTRSNTELEWTEVQYNSMKKIKRMVTEAPIQAFYDPAKEPVVESDASQKGLVAVLMRQGRPIAYASRAWTQTETRYAQIEKDTLSIVFSLDTFHPYVFACKTTVFNDHKPIEALMKKTMHRAPGRLQSMFLNIHGYDVNIVFRKGKEMYISDMLSGAYLHDTGNQSEITHVKMVPFPTCGRMHLPALSLWPGRQPCRPHLVDDRRGGGPSSVALRSRNPPTGRRRDGPISSSLFSHGPPLCAVG